MKSYSFKSYLWVIATSVRIPSFPPFFNTQAILYFKSSIQMKQITLHKTWIIKAPIQEIFKIITDFENLPKYFPKVAKSVKIKKREGNNLEIEAVVKSFGKNFPVKIKTQIVPEKGFISDNDSYKFGTSGHEKLFLSQIAEWTIIDYTYQVSIHKTWLRIIATPLIRWYSMKFWEKAVIDELKKIVEKQR